MQRDITFHSLYEALDREHCAICHVSLQSVEKYLWAFLYEGVNDPWLRPELIKARGFCPVHAWRLPAFFDSATGVAIVYRHLLEEFQRAFVMLAERQTVGAGGPRWFPWSAPVNQETARGIRTWLEPQTVCPACREQWGTEDRLASAAARAVSDGDFRARYEASMGLCVRHLAAVFDEPMDSPDWVWLSRAERHLIERLIHELSEFWRKHDYRFHDEPMGEERTSWRRVLHKLAGAPGIVWRRLVV